MFELLTPLMWVFFVCSGRTVSMSPLLLGCLTSGASIGRLSSLLELLMLECRCFVIGQSIRINETSFRLFSRFFLLSIFFLSRREKIEFQIFSSNHTFHTIFICSLITNFCSVNIYLFESTHFITRMIDKTITIWNK